MRFIIAWCVLAMAMLVLVLVIVPSPQTIGLCFLAWFGGVASTLAAQAVGQIRSNR